MNLIKILLGYLSLISELDERILFSNSDRVENINYINEHNSQNLSYTLGINDFIEYDFINETYPLEHGLIYSDIDDNATLSVFSETDDKNIIKGIRAKNLEAYKTAAELLTAITLIGLQRNLIDKLNYITHEHPFREVKVEE